MILEDLKETELMCCIICGHIAGEDDPYESEYDSDQEDYPICPECGEYYKYGEKNYAPAYLWSEEQLEKIISQNSL